MINNTKVICPLCESGELIFKTSPWTYCYKEHNFVLEDIEFAECTSCHSELILPDQSRRNESRIRDEHRKIDGLLTSIDIGNDINPRSPKRSFVPDSAKHLSTLLNLEGLVKLY